MEKELSTANNQSLMDCTNNPDRDHSYAKKNDHAKQEKRAKLSMKLVASVMMDATDEPGNLSSPIDAEATFEMLMTSTPMRKSLGVRHGMNPDFEPSPITAPSEEVFEPVGQRDMSKANASTPFRKLFPEFPPIIEPLEQELQEDQEIGMQNVMKSANEVAPDQGEEYGDENKENELPKSITKNEEVAPNQMLGEEDHANGLLNAYNEHEINYEQLNQELHQDFALPDANIGNEIEHDQQNGEPQQDLPNAANNGNESDGNDEMDISGGELHNDDVANDGENEIEDDQMDDTAGDENPDSGMPNEGNNIEVNFDRYSTNENNDSSIVLSNDSEDSDHPSDIEVIEIIPHHARGEMPNNAASDSDTEQPPAREDSPINVSSDSSDSDIQELAVLAPRREDLENHWELYNPSRGY